MSKTLNLKREDYHPDFGYPRSFRIKAVTIYRTQGIERAIAQTRVSRASIKAWAKHYDIKVTVEN